MKTFKYLSGIVLLAVLLLFSCSKDTGKEVAKERYLTNASSLMQLFNGIVNSKGSFLFVDGKQQNGTIIGYNAVFPNATAPVGFAIRKGSREFLVRDTAAATIQPAMTFTGEIGFGGKYTLFTYDTVTSPKYKLVEDNIEIPNDTTARLRFANLIYSASPLPAGVDIYSVKAKSVIFSNIKQTEVTPYIPYASARTDTFYVREHGSNADLQNADTTGKPTKLTILAVLNPVKQRSYTLIYRGGSRNNSNKTADGKTAIAAARGLTVFANR